MTSLYRMSGAKTAIDQCRKVGVVLLANGTGVHAVPRATLNQYPWLLGMVRRYRDGIMQTLDNAVE